MTLVFLTSILSLTESGTLLFLSDVPGILFAEVLFLSAVSLFAACLFIASLFVVCLFIASLFVVCLFIVSLFVICLFAVSLFVFADFCTLEVFTLLFFPRFPSCTVFPGAFPPGILPFCRFSLCAFPLITFPDPEDTLLSVCPF